MSYYALVEFASSPGAQTFAFSFPYLDRDHLHIYVDGAERLDFTFLSEYVLQLNTPLPALPESAEPGTTYLVRVVRQTPIDEPAVDFVNGATDTADYLDLANLQQLYATQELTDSFEVIELESTLRSLKNAKVLCTASADVCQDFANDAEASAVASATSATNALDSETQAAEYRDAASAYQSQAALNQNDAANYAASAIQSALTASSLADQAATSASAASTSASTATTQAGLAATAKTACDADKTACDADKVACDADVVSSAASAAAAATSAGSLANIFTTGDVKLTLKTVADTTWVLMNDTTIGDASSSATGRANADTADLFTLLWTNIIDQWCPVSTGRGASAAADFAAHKTIALPRTLGRALAGYGTGVVTDSGANADVDLTGNTLTVPTNNTKWVTGMPVVFTLASGTITGLTTATTYYVIRSSATLLQLASSLANAQNGTAIDLTAKSSPVWSVTHTYTTRAMGEQLGAETHPMTSTQLLAHTHDAGASSQSGGESGGPTNRNTTVGTIDTGSRGGNEAMNIMQPTLFLNVMVKL